MSEIKFDVNVDLGLRTFDDETIAVVTTAMGHAATEALTALGHDHTTIAIAQQASA